MRVIGEQVVMVFGASSGIGRATALRFAAEGAAVVVAARRGELVAELAAEVEAGGGRAVAAEADVTDRAAVDAAVQAGLERFGKIDVLVNAAGINIPKRRMEVLTADDWGNVLAINLNGAFNTTQAVLAPMRSNGGGLIIQLSSVSGKWGDVSGAAYQASKHGVVGLCYATMVEERQNGIRTTAIMPGLVETPLLKNRPVPPPREVLDQAVQPEDVAHACIFLAGLPARTYVPELLLLPGGLQYVGNTVV